MCVFISVSRKPRLRQYLLPEEGVSEPRVSLVPHRVALFSGGWFVENGRQIVVATWFEPVYGNLLVPLVKQPRTQTEHCYMIGEIFH